MRYQIELTRAARRGLAALPRNALVRVDARILSLADNPRPTGVKALRGEKRVLRVRVGDYRILYRVEDDRLVVLVIRVEHRREAYRRV